MVDRCELTDLLVDQCAHCTGRDGGEQKEARRLSILRARPDVFTAQYPGACADRGEWFQAGAPIQAKPGSDFRWRSACCIVDGDA